MSIRYIHRKLTTHLTLILTPTVFQMLILKTCRQVSFLKRLPINSATRLKQHVTWKKSTLHRYHMNTPILTTLKKEIGCRTPSKDSEKLNFPAIKKFIFLKN